MFIKRHLSSFVMAALFMASVGACNDRKPTIQGARPLSSQPAGVPGRVTMPDEAPATADVLDTPVAQTTDDDVEPRMPKAALPTHDDVDGLDEPVLVPPAPFVPEGAIGSQDGFPVFPAPGVVLPDNMPEASYTAPSLPTPRCMGEAMTCDRINDFGAEWLSNCGGQQGCDVDAVCRPRDTLDCASVTDQHQCETQGCTWFTPVPAAADAPTRRWYDPRRYVDIIEKEVINPAVTLDYDLYSMHTGFAAGRTADKVDDTALPSVCVAPEQTDIAAVCNALSTADACQSHDAICTWAPIGCVGASHACDAFAEQDVCNSQIGCTWGVE